MIESINQAGGAGGGGTVDTVVAGTGISVNSTDPANPIITNTSLNTDETAKVSANDTTAGYLNGKLVAGSGIALTENNNGGNETLTVASTVTPGVTGFTGSQNTAAPNNTVNASQLLVNAGTTNADAVIQPKGTGAFQLALADGTATGGNKRGVGAVDLQGPAGRTLAAQVASGVGSFAVGLYNTASGQSSVAMGTLNNATQTSSTAIGEYSQANAYGMFAHASGRFTNNGDAQYERYILRRATTSATPLELSCDGNAPTTGTRIAIPTDTAFVFHAFVVARYISTDNESAGYEIKGVIDNNSGTVAFVGTPTVTILGEDIAGWDVAVTADNTNKSLAVTATGENAKTIRWVATVHLTKVPG